MRCVFQIVHGPDGRRSPALEASREKFADWLVESRDQLGPDALVLVIADDTSGVLDVSTAPMMSVERFIAEFRRSP